VFWLWMVVSSPTSSQNVQFLAGKNTKYNKTILVNIISEPPVFALSTSNLEK
jgi:hypothetical protein